MCCLHVLLVEPEAHRARALAQMLGALGIVTTRVTDTEQGTLLLTQIKPDGLVVGVHPTTVQAQRFWLSALLDVAPLPTVLYAEHGALLDLASRALPLFVTTTLWPCSQSELGLLLTSLLEIGGA